MKGLIFFILIFFNLFAEEGGVSGGGGRDAISPFLTQVSEGGVSGGGGLVNYDHYETMPNSFRVEYEGMEPFKVDEASGDFSIGYILGRSRNPIQNYFQPVGPVINSWNQVFLNHLDRGADFFHRAGVYDSRFTDNNALQNLFDEDIFHSGNTIHFLQQTTLLLGYFMERGFMIYNISYPENSRQLLGEVIFYCTPSSELLDELLGNRNIKDLIDNCQLRTETPIYDEGPDF